MKTPALLEVITPVVADETATDAATAPAASTLRTALRTPTLALNAGRVDEAETLARESLLIADQIGDHGGRVFGVGLFAALASTREQPERAERLWTAVADEDAGAPLGGWRRHRHNLEATIRSKLGGAWRSPDQTNAVTLDDAVTLALGARGRPRAGVDVGSADAA